MLGSEERNSEGLHGVAEISAFLLAGSVSFSLFQVCLLPLVVAKGEKALSFNLKFDIEQRTTVSILPSDVTCSPNTCSSVREK